MNLYKANSSKKKNESETITKGFCPGVEHHKVGCPRVEHHKVGQLPSFLTHTHTTLYAK
jgi:hypothetical protein